MNVLLGKTIVKGIISGKACVNFKKFEKGNILVVKQTTPHIVPLMLQAKGLVTERGGILSHAAIVSREIGLPCVIGVKEATKKIKHGQNLILKLDKSTGEIILK